MKRKTNFFVLFLYSIISSIMFFMANPNFIFSNGLGFLAWFYYIPLLVLIKKSVIKNVWILGFVYGFVSYALLCNWMFTSYRIYYFIISVVFGIILALLFLLLKLSEKLFSNYSFLIKGLILCGYEFIHTLGPLGFNYGTTCYTQFKYTILIQSLDLTGPFGLNFLIIFSSCIIYGFFEKLELKKEALYEIQNANSTGIVRFAENKKYERSISTKPVIVSAIVFAVLFTANLVYGIVKYNQIENKETIKIVAVQSNEDPWLDGVEYYSSTVRKLTRLTDEALELYPETEIVIWPETAVVPDITKNFYNSTDERRHSLVLNLLKFINKKHAEFVIGNGHQVDEKIFNSALIFTPSENVIPPDPEVYSKVHLVPFTEYFPFKKILPFVYKNLKEKDNNWWDAGNSYISFNKNKIYFSTPICFEDTFTDTGRKMFKAGARCFVNLSNDSWANSEACQKQHLAMAIFRCVENRIPAVRCSTSGETCYVNCKGKIVESIPPFTEDFLAVDVEIHDKNQKTGFYTKTGDILGYIPLIFLVGLLISKIFICYNKKK